MLDVFFRLASVRACVGRDRSRAARVVALALLAGAAATAPTSSQAPPAVVVLLHSYDSTYPWTADQQAGVMEALAPLGAGVSLRVEYLDARREGSLDIRARVGDLLAVKYANATPRVVVATDDAAVEFLAARPSLFRDVPVVFGGVNSTTLLGRLPRTRFTGVTERTDARRFIREMLSLRPTTRRVFVVTDSTQASTELARDVVETARQAAVAVTPLSGERLRFDQILAALRTDTRAEDLVVVRPLRVDATGHSLDAVETTAAIVSASRAPVVSPNLSELGQGVLAGIASQGRQHGRLIGAKALAVLRGESVADLPIEPAIDDQLAFDAQQLARWNLSESDLPRGAMVVNHPPSFYRANKALIWGGVALLLVQSGVIVALVWTVRARRRAQRTQERQAAQLQASHHALDRAHQSLLHEQEGRRRAEESLGQAQKMEALGRLAGGVAHDFNNLLTIILGHSTLLQERLPAGTDLRVGASEIRQAGEQAATLTRQLLAFSRKQVVPIRPRDVRAAVLQLEPIVRRLLPESIVIDLRLDPTLPPVLIGEGQIEQILLNLAANARDAMPDGGRLEVETSRVQLQEPLLADPDVAAGTYLRLRVTDTGKGMDAETQRRIFEPFFTTKSPGRGTGIGLATVYGIVKQHSGGVSVTSAPEHGTTFAIYLPLPTGRERQFESPTPVLGAR
jgi:signal transduction histidine kinase